MQDRGEWVHGEVSSADASSGVAFTLYDAEQNSRALASTERLVIGDLLVVSVPGGDVRIVCDTDAAGKRVVKGTVVANGGLSRGNSLPYYGKKGVVPKVFAPAGQVD